MNVLSLFDGMSCGQQALVRSGIKYDKYFASEIDKYAITVTMANFPETIQLGSVVDVDGYALPKIDLLIGGSPCQSFSFAGKRKGMSTKDSIEILTLDHYLELKSQQYEFEGQSYLFWEYMRLLNETKPKHFLLENVMMGEKWERVLSKAIGVNPIEINSSLVSAQNRRRLYWTNIGMQPAGLFGELQSVIKQPKDKGILLKDILEPEVDEKYYLSEKMMNYLTTRKDNFNDKFEDDKASCINKSSASIDISDNIIVEQKKSQKEHLIEKIGVDATQELEPIILDVYNKKLKRDYKVPTLTDPCHNSIRLIEPKIITHYMPEIVKVRKYEVNIAALQDCLKNHKKPIKEIQQKLGISKTTIEHWFRKDTYFSIPDAEIWFELKNILEIETDEFDKSITEFEEREGVFDKNNRVYDENGLSPTLTSTSASDEKILVRPIKLDLQINDSQSGAVYSVEGKSVNLCANGGGQGAKTGLYAVGLTEVRTEESFSPNFFCGTNPKRAKELAERTDDKTGALLTSPTNDNLIKEVIAGDYRTDEGVRWRENGKSPTLMARAREDLSRPPLVNTFRIRRLTPIECERLQTVADNYTNHVSDNQRYKMLGNGWTVDVISHIFSQGI